MDHRATEGAMGKRDLGFERWVATGVEDFAGVDLGDAGHLSRRIGCGWGKLFGHGFSRMGTDKAYALVSRIRVIRVHPWRKAVDRKSVVSGKSVLVRVDLGGRRLINNKKTITSYNVL